ncbi:MAG: glucose 1-dehydrogenase [Alphaproteobacteria bacterium]|nr:glucose 1-dehydrogenase [Alphaproteobacteria bacterium]
MKQAIVTGAAGGIGKAIAELAAARGYRVGVLDLDPEAVGQAAASLDGAVPLPADVSDEASVEAALERFGETPDLLVNCAGILRVGPLAELSADDFRAVVNVNLTGAFIAGRAAATRMMRRGSGCIVNVTSVVGIDPSPGSGAYGAAKAGLANLTRLMTLEWGPAGIRVNAVAPGFIDAGMSAPFYADPAVRALRGGGVPLRRLGTAEDVARTVLFLASDEASYISGEEIVVDGGVIHSVLAQLPRKAPEG